MANPAYMMIKCKRSCKKCDKFDKGVRQSPYGEIKPIPRVPMEERVPGGDNPWAGKGGKGGKGGGEKGGKGGPTRMVDGRGRPLDADGKGGKGGKGGAEPNKEEL